MNLYLEHGCEDRLCFGPPMATGVRLQLLANEEPSESWKFWLEMRQ